MATDKQIVMDVIDSAQGRTGTNQMKTIGKFPDTISLNRIGPYGRIIHHQGVTPVRTKILAIRFSGVQMDFPRSVKMVDTDGHGGNAGTPVIINGINSIGQEVTETVLVGNESNNAFMFINYLEYTRVVVDGIDAQLGSKFGMPFDLGTFRLNAVAYSSGDDAKNGFVMGRHDARLDWDDEYDTVWIDPILLDEVSGVFLTFFVS